MKFKLTKEQIQQVVDDPIAAESAKIKVSDPWWIIALKVVAYLVGLLLAGSCTSLVAAEIIS